VSQSPPAPAAPAAEPVPTSTAAPAANPANEEPAIEKPQNGTASVPRTIAASPPVIVEQRPEAPRATGAAAAVATAAPNAPTAEPGAVRFEPAGGSLIVRVFPISGFQGLMRAQDALARLDAVRAATVEAYAQGEARLRIQLGNGAASDELAAGLHERLSQVARVRAASIADRSVLIVLE
jgi:hypothetical protein